MLVVLAIVGLCIAIAAPAVRNVSSGGSVASSAKELAALLRAARAEAILSGSATSVTIDLVGKRAAASWDSDVVAIPPAAVVTVRSAREESANAALPGFRFFADGSGTGGSVRLQSDRVSQLIAIDWLTGRVDRVVER
jgi:general secretion pathway protein H